MHPFRSVRRPTAVVAVAALVAILPSPAPAATNQRSAERSPVYPSAVRPSAARVTLLTGDVVELVEAPGSDPTVNVIQAERPGRSEQVAFVTERRGEKFYVIPSDVRPYLEADRLDRELFDVKGLIRQGLTDNKTTTLPLILTYGKGIRSAATTLPAVTGKPRTLPSINGTALKVVQKKAGEFWAALATPGARALDRNVGKIWLDQRLRVTLDESVPRTGAPEAWRAGFDGTGVEVAVVDTGIDAAHPDLADKVIEARSFVEGDESADDGHGHGTHVASTIVGSGAKSGGRFKGMAPGAKLNIAKVCDAGGECEESALLAGLDWAAHTGAKVVNVSIGGGISDGTDLLSQRVDELTAETGVLFVIAAGNLGCAPCVTAPGAASSALTVGAVDKAGKLADFSSRGPRWGDAVVKPEIVAPGVAITAARAAGTLPDYPGDDDHVELNGTSMATPHVAGAAAILSQARPNDNASELKAALSSTAEPGAGKWNEQGAGELDVPRALGALQGPASVSFGALDRARAETTSEATYTNRNNMSVTLKLGLTANGWDGRATNAIRLSATELILPANGAATVRVTVDPSVGEPGTYGGVLTATGGGTELRTPVSWHVPYSQGKRHKLTVKVLDRQGKPLPDELPYVVRDAATIELTPNDPFAVPESVFYGEQTAPGVWVTSVPDGRYTAFTIHGVLMPDKREATLLAASDIAVGDSRTVTLDGRKAVPAKAISPDPTYRYNQAISVSAVSAGGGGVTWGAGLGGSQFGELFATPTAGPRRGVFAISETYTLGEQTVSAVARVGTARVRTPQVGTANLDLPLQYEPYRVARRLGGRHTLPVVFAGAGSPAEVEGLNVRGKLVLLRLPMPSDSEELPWWWAVPKAAEDAAKRLDAAGAIGILPYVDSPGALPLQQYDTGAKSNGVPFLGIGFTDGERLRKALTADVRVDLELQVRPNPRYAYNLHYAPPQGIPSSLVHRVQPSALKRIQTRYHADVASLALYAWMLAFQSDRGGSYVAPAVYFQAPAEIDQYVGGIFGKQTWRREARLTNGVQQYAQLDFVPYRTPTESWFAGPITMVDPRQEFPGFFRYRPSSGPDWLFASPYLGDSTAGHFVEAEYSAYPFKYRMFHGDQELPARIPPYSRTPYFELSAESGEYRMKGTFELPKGNVRGLSDRVRTMSPRVDNVWTFRTVPPTGPDCGPAGYVCSVPPLLQLHYELGVDPANRAKAGSTHAMRVTVAAPPRAVGEGRVAGLTMRYSMDQGTTWLAAKAIGLGGGRYLVLYPDRAPAGTRVWLRSEAWDSKGNRVDQTIRDAYELR